MWERLYSRVRSSAVLVLFAAISVTAQAGPYYVVVGTFSGESTASKFSAALRKVFSGASFKSDNEHKRYHVYLMETSRQLEAEYFLDDIQQSHGFAHAWIYTDLIALSHGVDDTAPSSDGIRLELHTGGTVLLASADHSNLSIRRSYTEKSDTAQVMEKSFRFVAETVTGRGLPAGITILSKSGGAISSFKSDEVVTFASRQSRVLTLMCKAPGYGTVTRQLDMGNLNGLRDVHRNADGIWEVRFSLTKIKVDDMKLHYNSIFSKDAAVLQPAAKDAMEDLLALLEENSAWKIAIHSHCNAGAKRDIVVRGEGGYFDLSQARKRSASDKQLTTARSETIRDYLVDHGIDSSRISIMAWGSLDPVVQPDAAKAYMNERVEVSVISNQ